MNDIVLADGQYSATRWNPQNGLDYDQWYAVGERLARIGGAIQWWIGDWIRYGEHNYGEKYAQALTLFDGQYEYQTLRQLVYVAGRVSNRFDNLSWTHHMQVASLDPAGQLELLEMASRGDWNVRQLQQKVRTHKRQQWLAHKGVDQVVTDLSALLPNSYRVLYADPPWAYDNTLLEMGTLPEDYYPSMPTHEIADLPVGRLAQDNSVLFLWSPSPKLPEALLVAEAWGFTYRTSYIWDKVAHVMGYYNSVRHEILLVCGRGSSAPDNPQQFDSVVVEKRGEHSTKPPVFRQMIDALYLHGKRLELFARTTSPNWDVWGNEVTQGA